jgi:hypothetical protein
MEFFLYSFPIPLFVYPVAISLLYVTYCSVLSFARRPHSLRKEVQGGGVGVLLAADSQSTSKSGYRASIRDP